VSERSRQDAEEERIEETVAQLEASPDLVVRSVERATPGGEEARERPSLLDMLFREAEVIARNLKESGTRR
jgi:Fe-S cluster assembly ATPase SufC